MKEAMDLLEDIRDLDLEMQKIDRKIDAIDNGVRNRAYTLVEIKQEDILQAELDEKRKQRSELLLQLENILEDDKKEKELKVELMRRYQESSNDEERSEIGYYVEITRQVTSKISERKMANRINSITSSNNSNSRFGQKYSKEDDDLEI